MTTSTRLTGRFRAARAARALTAAATAVAVMLGMVALAAPAQAAGRVSPGSFTGYAFDATCTPTQAQMDVWRTTSPFWGVGVYLGGSSMACDDQSALTASWVTKQTRRGWIVLPLWVGPQAACTSYADRIADAPGRNYAAANRQGRREARRAIARAQELGIHKGSTLWYDLEDFALAGDDCRRSALRFLSGWTEQLHGRGWTSGVYGNVAAAVHALDNADKLSPGSYTMPDQIWYAWNNGKANTAIKTRWVRPNSWRPGGRVHQYALDTTAGYGGVELHIDRNFVDVGRGSVAPRARHTCGVDLDFRHYRRLVRGSRGAQVQALECLLRQKRKFHRRIDGRFDRATYRAVKAFQRSRDLRVTGRVTKGTWTVLLAEGPSPVLKVGSAQDAVRRVQRALNASVDARLRITGVYNRRTEQRVKRFQKRHHLDRTGVVAGDTWAALEH
jgi:hypothetical protein